jgi:DNA-directed RNA polymerase subunit RPC12/RpoP
MLNDYIKVSNDSNYLLIDNCILLLAYIVDDTTKCNLCQSTVLYHETFDTYFCAYCNTWLEKKCGDINCVYCQNRPDTPLPNENERNQSQTSGKAGGMRM